MLVSIKQILLHFDFLRINENIYDHYVNIVYF